MATRKKTPTFATEAEEARWWVEQEDRLAVAFVEASQKGSLGRGTVMKRAALPTTTIRLDPTDIALARAQAEQKGMRYQTYLKQLLHEALRRKASRH